MKFHALKFMRLAKQMSQKELAEKMKCSRQLIASYETAKLIPPEWRRAQMARIFNTDYETINKLFY
jgi:ribosome-binding protein aMBF1 (putative translation factor)